MAAISLPFRSRSAARAGAQARATTSALARKEALWFYVLISPWIAGYILFTGGPTLASFYLSFTHNDPVNWPPTWTGLTNYRVMFADRIFWKSLQVTSYYTMLAVPLSFAFATWIALMLNERVPGQSFWRTIYYLPAIVAGVPVAIMWAWIFQPQFGLVNGTLYSLFGIQGPRWLSDPSWAVPTFVIMSLWQFGGPMLIYLAAIQGVPTQLYESAQLDGANKLQQIWHITMPAISPVIFFNGVMAIIASFQVFTNAYVITQGGPNYATWFMVYMIYQNAFTYISNMGYADALSLVLFVIMLLFTFLAFRLSRNVVHYESVVK
jgi:multiple sugar transport system permease protein